MCQVDPFFHLLFKKCVYHIFTNIKVFYTKEELIINEQFIFDGHVHITPPEIIQHEDEYRRKDPYFELLCSSKVNKFTTGDELIAAMEESNWEKSIVFGFAFKNNELCKIVNRYTIKMVQKYPKKLVGFAVVNPLASDVKEELQRCKEAGLKGVGELFPFGQEFDVTNKGQLKIVCDFCRENNWPLLIHFNEPVGHYYKGKTKDSIRKAAKLAINFPDVKFIYAHLGGGLCFYELMPEMKEKLQNVYYDTAAQPFLYDNNIYKVFRAAGLIDKIILGSDYPLLSPLRYINSIESTVLSRIEIRKITNENLKKLLKEK